MPDETQDERDTEAAFVDAMKQVRTQQGISQGEFAKRLADLGVEGMHQNTISRIEKRERPLRLNEAISIANALGIPLGAFVPGIGGVDDQQAHVRELQKLVESASDEALRKLVNYYSQLLQLAHELDELPPAAVPPAASRLVTAPEDLDGMARDASERFQQLSAMRFKPPFGPHLTAVFEQLADREFHR